MVFKRKLATKLKLFLLTRILRYLSRTLIFVISENRCTHETCITFFTSISAHQFYGLKNSFKKIMNSYFMYFKYFFFEQNMNRIYMYK